MPELPEVETVVRALGPQLIGRRIAAVRVSRHRLRRQWSAQWATLLVGRKITRVHRRGKWIILGLMGDVHLVIHLGMTGQLTVRPAEAPVEPHTHITVSLGNREKELRFRDVRRFGSATLFRSAGQIERFFQEARLGPEPFTLESKYWRDRLAATARSLKTVLLDQRVVAGVGNIYADEALFQARLHPARRGRSTSGAEAARLKRALIKVLNRAIHQRGSSIRDYVDGSGRKGDYQREFLVYSRAGEPCPRCRAPIARIRLAGRSTHFCPQCQVA